MRIYKDRTINKLMKVASFVAASAIIMTLFSPLAAQAFAEEAVAPANDEILPVKIEVEYHQTEARKMLDLINEFRTSDEAWCLAPNNVDKIYVEAGKCVYDYNLEKIAMQRAAEIAISFSHDRPNGRDIETYEEDFDVHGLGLMGENIEINANGTSEYAINQFKETDESYFYQGHRRSMLSPYFNAVGCACVYIKGYCYWVQEFGDTLSTSRDYDMPAIYREITENGFSSKTPQPCDTQVNVSVDVIEQNIKHFGFDQEGYIMEVGEVRDITDFRTVVVTQDTFAGTRGPHIAEGLTYEIEPTLSANGTPTISFDGKSITANAVGNATLRVKYRNRVSEASIIVEPAATKKNPEYEDEKTTNDDDDPVEPVPVIKVPKDTKITKLKQKSGGFKVFWKKVSDPDVTGYVVSWSRNKHFTGKSAKSVTVHRRYGSRVISPLKDRKRYWVKVQTYKQVDSKKYISHGVTRTIKIKWSKKFRKYYYRPLPDRVA